MPFWYSSGLGGAKARSRICAAAQSTPLTLPSFKLNARSIYKLSPPPKV